MLRFGVVVILMNLDLEEVEFLSSTGAQGVQSLTRQGPLNPFEDSIIEYLDQLSMIIRNDPRIRDFPDVATFSFFCRRGNLIKEKKAYADSARHLRKGRGLVFHICPSNVPVNFAFSFVAGLLAGNSNLVRVPSRSFDQVKIILDAVNKLNEENKFIEIGRRLAFVRYDKNSTATKEFSQCCDARVIWGGDNTIREVRKHPTKSRSIDVCFADRVSICIIDASCFLNFPNKGKIINGFYNDSYLFDQNACTAPKLIIWRGTPTEIIKAQDYFWSELHILVQKRYEISGVMSVTKLCSLYEEFINNKNIVSYVNNQNYIYRNQLRELEINFNSFSLRYGHFFEFYGCLSDIIKIDSKKLQTLSHFGIQYDELLSFIDKNNLLGIDRIVPIGSTLDFSLKWDGYDLIYTLSRHIEIL